MVTVDDYIGRRDNTGRAAADILTVSGTRVLATAGLGRRDSITVTNTGGVAAKVYTTASGGSGISLASAGGSFSDSSSANLYLESTGAATTIEVYESLSPRNYDL